MLSSRVQQRLHPICIALVAAFIMPGFVAAQIPGPTEAHKLLQKDVGTWKAKMTMFIAPDGTQLPQPMVSEGMETNRMIGGMWLIGDFEGKIAGMDFKGHSVSGYDGKSKKYTGSWVDSMTPTVSHMTGVHDKKSNSMVWEMTSIGPEGKPMKGKSVQEYKDDGKTRVFTMYNPVPGKDEMVKSMQIIYTKLEED